MTVATEPLSWTKGREDRHARTNAITQQLSDCPDEARPILLEQLIEANMVVADSIVSRYRGRGIATDDLRQVAYLALTKAAQRFDPAAGPGFLAFAVPTIRGEVRRHFRDHGWMVRPPRRIQELQPAIGLARTELTRALGRPPTPAEIALELDEEIDDVLEALDAQGCFSPASLDLPTLEDGSTTLGDSLTGPDDDQDAAEARLMLAPAVRHLSERDRRILRLRFVEELTQREIAADIGVTQMQVSRLLTRILGDLRASLGSMDAPAA
jgi:RNA polymerase sigma-B factor